VRTRTGLADVVALAGLIFALVAVTALSLVFVGEPLIASWEGPSPCGVKGSIPDPQTDPGCLSAHLDYYQHDPVADAWTTPEMRLSMTVDPIAWPAGFFFGLVGGLTGGIALAMSTRRRRTAITALTFSSVIVVGIVVVFIGLAAGGGD
jgi:hypothetical protein